MCTMGLKLGSVRDFVFGTLTHRVGGEHEQVYTKGWNPRDRVSGVWNMSVACGNCRTNGDWLLSIVLSFKQESGEWCECVQIRISLPT